MTGKFTRSHEARREDVPWGSLAWFSSPGDSGAQSLVVVEVDIEPGTGHDFHRHPRQDEVIYVLDGEVEQWVDRERRVLVAGDSAYIGPDVVHASFNVSDSRSRILAILGPSIGEEGYELVDMAGEAPWNSIRSADGRA